MQEWQLYQQAGVNIYLYFLKCVGKGFQSLAIWGKVFEMKLDSIAYKQKKNV